MKKNFKFYRLNYQIQAPSFRLLDESGKQIGILTKNDALRLAQTESKDLVEIAGKANPPVVKLIDFKKFKYLEAKKERESKKQAKHVGSKEIRLSPFIGENDFNTRIKKAEDFLAEGHQLRISILFRGREITKKEFGFAVMNKALERLGNSGKILKSPYFEGKILVGLLTPVKVKGEKNA